MDYSQFKESLSAAALIYELEPTFTSSFYLTCDISEAERIRKQRDAVRLITLTKEQLESSGTEYNLIVTNQDLFMAKLEFILGLANYEMRAGLLSTNRLVRWEEGRTPSQTQERILKEAAHEIGHLVGLEHCTKSPSCIMSQSKTVEELDAKLPMLCLGCSSKKKMTIS